MIGRKRQSGARLTQVDHPLVRRASVARRLRSAEEVQSSTSPLICVCVLYRVLSRSWQSSPAAGVFRTAPSRVGRRGESILRILHVVAPAEVGGLERVVELLARGQARSGEEIHVAGVLDRAHADHLFVRLLTAAGIATHPIALPARAYFRERTAMRELCHRLRPDVVHTHGARPDVVDARAARQLGIPVVTTVHGFTGGDWKNRLYEQIQRRAFRKFDAVVAVSRPLGEQLIRDGVPRSRVHIIRNAWEATSTPLDRAAARSALGAREDGFLVGWAGRLSREKGLDVLLDALVHLSDLPVHLSVVGNGPGRLSLAARMAELGLERRVRWHGIVPEAGGLFSAFDTFVLSSRTEGTPIVLFEAMATGIPIVATCVGGVPDVLSLAEAALVPPDDPAALAAAIRAIYHNPAVARERAHRARARLLRDFGVAPWVGRYEAIYRLVSREALTPAAR